MRSAAGRSPLVSRSGAGKAGTSAPWWLRRGYATDELWKRLAGEPLVDTVVDEYTWDVPLGSSAHCTIS